MPRQPRVAPPGYIYHVTNRAVDRLVMLKQEGDFATMERSIIDAHQRVPLPILAYCLLGDRWHFIVSPTKPRQMSRFFRILTVTHALRWRADHPKRGTGGLYRSRFKSFVIQPGAPLRQVLRYVESAAVAEKLSKRPQAWRWSSLRAREHGAVELRQVLAKWPAGTAAGWAGYVNQRPEPCEADRLATSVRRGRPYGDDAWVARIAARLGLEYTIRPQGRPRKVVAEKPDRSKAGPGRAGVSSSRRPKRGARA